VGEKTAGVGHFQIPTAPAGLTAVTQSASANTLGSAAAFGNAPAAIYITGIHIGAATTQTPTYVLIQVLVGASIVGQYIVPYGVSAAAAASVLTGFRTIYPPIPVANGAAITVKSASSVASAVAWGVSLECINQSNVVDDGVAVGTVTTVTNQLTAAQIATGVWQDTTSGDFTTALSVGKSVMNGVTLGTGLTVASVSGSVGSVTGLTASNLDATISSRMATYTQPTGFLAATFPATVASTTNITSASGISLAASQHVIVDSGTVTTLTNLPAITANWLTAAGITAGALNGKGDWNIGKTGYSLVAGYDLAKTAAQAGDAMTLTAAYNAAKTASQAGDAMALTAAERASVADALLARNVSGGSSAGRTVKQALAVLRNKVEVVAGTLNVYDTDDTTVLFTAAVTTAVGNPIASIDPA
jgi:hypothetical protein